MWTTSSLHLPARWKIREQKGKSVKSLTVVVSWKLLSGTLKPVHHQNTTIRPSRPSFEDAFSHAFVLGTPTAELWSGPHAIEVKESQFQPVGNIFALASWDLDRESTLPLARWLPWKRQFIFGVKFVMALAHYIDPRRVSRDTFVRVSNCRLWAVDLVEIKARGF